MGTPSVFSCLYVTEAVLLAFPHLSKTTQVNFISRRCWQGRGGVEGAMVPDSQSRGRSTPPAPAPYVHTP